jgi:hypothetical protein
VHIALYSTKYMLYVDNGVIHIRFIDGMVKVDIVYTYDVQVMSNGFVTLHGVTSF